MKKIIVLSLFLILLSSCASIYLAPNGQKIAQNHQSVAILKPDVSFKARQKDNANALKESQTSSSFEFQQEIYKWMLKRIMQGAFEINIQDVSETNAKYRAAFGDETPASISTEKLCKVLDVDGVILSNFALSKPMSTGGAIALGLLTGVFGNTNEAVISMSIKNCEDKSLLWKYDHKFSGGLISSPATLVDGLMRNASKKMPYRKQ